MRQTYIFKMDCFLYDIKEDLIRFIEYPNIKMTSIVQSILDEVCFIRGRPLEGYSSPLGKSLAIEDLLSYDIPLEICTAVVSFIESRILDELMPLIDNSVNYRLSYIQLNEFDYAITIFYYRERRFQIRPHETVYAS